MLLVEDKSRNTNGNATLTKSILEAHGFKTGVLRTRRFTFLGRVRGFGAAST